MKPRTPRPQLLPKPVTLLLIATPQRTAEVIRARFPLASILVALRIEAALRYLADKTVKTPDLVVTAPVLSVVKRCQMRRIPVLVQTVDRDVLSLLDADAFINLQGPEYPEVLTTSIRALTGQFVDNSHKSPTPQRYSGLHDSLD